MSEEEDVTEEQRALISSKFRAAKALLSRKRPSLSPLPPLLRRFDIAHSSALPSCVQRPPLSDISINTAVFQESITKPSTILTRIQEDPVDGAPAKDSCESRCSVASPEQTGKFLTKDSFFTSGSVITDDELDSVLLEEVNLLRQLKYLDQRVGDDLDSGVKDDKESPSDGRICSSSISTIRVTEYRGNSNDDMRLASSFQEIIASQTFIEGGMPEAYSRYLEKLNEKQLEAACSDISIPSMIIAGPGSGKTSTMVGRILVLLGKGIRASNILAMTFTTAAAWEMKDRIGTIAGKEVAKELSVSTFHSFSLQLCRSHAEKLERTSEFLIYGQGQQRRAVIEAMRLFEKENSKQIHDHPNLANLDDLNLPHLKDKSKKWQNFVSQGEKLSYVSDHLVDVLDDLKILDGCIPLSPDYILVQAKASGKTPQDFSKVGDHTRAAILKNYEDILKSCNALDYHDLISCSVNLLSNFPQVHKESKNVWKAIIIDEFQDTSSMQYNLLRSLASHNCITVVGDEDQSIFGFSGANISGFNLFRKDFPNHKEVRLVKNYRSTRCIVEAASFLIQKNIRRCQFKNVLTDNSSGSKITIKECCNEDAQCTFVIDKILEALSNNLDEKSSFGDIAILYRRQVSGKVFQSAFRDRNIPFNVHGVAFYRKKVVRAIISMLKTTLPGCDDGPYRQVFKVLLPLDKEEKKKVIGHVDKISAMRSCSFLSAASDIFVAKLSGTLKRNQLTSGRKVLSALDMLSKLVAREQSLSTVISSVANMVPQKYLLEQRAVVDFDGGKLLNEDSDLRTVLHYLLDDVSNFLSTKFVAIECSDNAKGQQEGCRNILKSFIDFISAREAENFRSRRDDNRNSVALTTIHQSKGLEWDTVFIIKISLFQSRRLELFDFVLAFLNRLLREKYVNELEIPLLHEHNGAAEEIATLVEEERRLLYVAMTRARKKLFILYVTINSNWQLLQPSRFLKEIPVHLLDFLDILLLSQVESPANNLKANCNLSQDGVCQLDVAQMERKNSEAEKLHGEMHRHPNDIDLNRSIDVVDAFVGNSFLKRFSIDERSVVSHLFHQWAKKPAFKDPKRLLDKVGFVIDERLRVNKNKHKDVLSDLKTCLSSDDALHYAQYVLRWEQIPADQRAHLMREKQSKRCTYGVLQLLLKIAPSEHFQKLRIEKSMGSAAPTLKQISYLQKLGCTVAPSSRLHASKLIEQYKSL